MLKSAKLGPDTTGHTIKIYNVFVFQCKNVFGEPKLVSGRKTND